MPSCFKKVLVNIKDKIKIKISINKLTGLVNSYMKKHKRKLNTNNIIQSFDII